MSEYTPTTNDVREFYQGQLEKADDGVYMFADEEKSNAEFDRWLAQVKADAWDEGHLHYQKRGPDNCMCCAYSEYECACGEFGTGAVVSLSENPYREATNE